MPSPLVHLEPTADGARLRVVFGGSTGNILTAAVIGEMRAAVAELGQHTHLKLLTIEGAGRHFSFGASVEEHAPAAIGRVLPEFHRLVLDLLAAPVTTAAIVRGRCLGGGFEVALACDLIFASDEAMLGVPEIALGVFPPAAAALLPARVGATRAARAVLTGEARPAEEWREAGLVELVAPLDRLAADVNAWFGTHLAPRSAAALRHAARASRLVLRRAVEPALADAERLYLDELMRTRDAAEGVAAFLEKRSPQWSDA